MTSLSNESGVSVIVGTLLLILITVTAAAGLAVMVSQMQKDEMNRQTHLNAVKNENITILNIALENNQTQWNETGAFVNGLPQNWSSIRLTLLNLNTDSVTVMGIGVNDHYALNFTDRSLTDEPESRIVYNSTNYLTIPPTQSRDVYIDFIANASDDPSGLIDFQRSQSFSVGSIQNIKVMTSLSNFFEKTLKPPVASSQIHIDTDNLGSITRDALVLDGSGSSADTSLVSWTWTIYDASGTCTYASASTTCISQPGNWTDESHITEQVKTGKNVRINSLNGNNPYYRARLTVTDSLGMSATSDWISIPVGNYNPPTRLQLSITSPPVCILGCPYLTYSNSTSPPPPPIQLNSILSAGLYDINNNPVKNEPVVFVIDTNPNTPQNCFSLDMMANVTDDNGVAQATIIQTNQTSPVCSQSVTLHAQSGKVLSPTILIPGI